MTVAAARSYLERRVRRLAARRPLRSSYVVALAAPLLLAAVLATAFGALAENVVDEEAVVVVDREIAQSLHEHANPAMTDLWLAVTNLGRLVGMGLLPAVAAVLLRGDRGSRLAARRERVRGRARSRRA